MVVYEENPDFNFTKPYSETTAQKIDAKVKDYLEDAYKVSKQTITKYKSTLEKIAKTLIEREYISGDEFAEMIDNPETIPLTESEPPKTKTTHQKKM
jgi:cell division protease FtsH